MGKAHMAKQQFEENFRLFGDSTAQPEKFNLYGGLTNLAFAVNQLQNDMATVLRTLQDIQQQVHRLNR